MASFSDEFNRADSTGLGANWSAWASTANVVSNAAKVTGNSYVENIQAYTATATSGVDQYARISWVKSVGSSYPCLMLRGSASGSPMYAVYFWLAEDKIEWVRKANAADGSFVTVESSGTTTVDDTDSWGVTVIGTGTSTVVRCWKNPTGNAPDSGGTTWGSASPTVTLTADPASAVNTGNYVGFGGESNDPANLAFDSFFGGDVPSGGGGGSVVVRQMMQQHGG